MQAFNSDIHFILRWLHITFGSVWIGLLFLQAFVLLPWIRCKPHPNLGSLRHLLTTHLTCLMLVAGITYSCGFSLLSDISHIVGRKMFTISWGLFILTAGYLGTQLLILTWGFIALPIRKELDSAPDTEDLVERRRWQRAEVASQWAIIGSIPFLFLMIAANHWVIKLDQQKLWTVFGAFAGVSSMPLVLGMSLSRRLPRWSIALIGVLLLGILIILANWAHHPF